LECVLNIDDRWLRVYSIHLTHLAGETRLPQIDQLLEIHHNAVMEGPPLMGDMNDGYWQDPGLGVDAPRDAILLGDFNFEPDSQEYDRIIGPESPYGGRMINPDGFVDAWVADGHDELEGSTGEIHGRPVRLDYCFVSTRLRDAIKSVRIDKDAQGSDHQPVWVELEW
jgi:endonuclease/exonuclease/phosphatase family metal-dependent hydrolase